MPACGDWCVVVLMEDLEATAYKPEVFSQKNGLFSISWHQLRLVPQENEYLLHFFTFYFQTQGL